MPMDTKCASAMITFLPCQDNMNNILTYILEKEISRGEHAINSELTNTLMSNVV